MSIFKTLGDAVRRVVGKGPSPVTPLTIANRIDQGQAMLGTLLEFLNDPKLATQCFGSIPNPPVTDRDIFVQKVIADFSKALPSRMMLSGRVSIVDHLRKTAQLLQTSFKTLADNLDTVFPTDTQEDVADLTVSQVVVLGTLEKSFMFERWVSMLIGVAMEHAMTSPTPPYQKALLLKDLPAVAELVASVAGATPAWSLMDIVHRVERSGKNVSLMSDNLTVDQFVSDNSFDRDTNVAIQGFLPSPFLAIGMMRVNYERRKLEQLEATREWLRRRVGLYRMAMANMDENSPEYQRQKKIADHFAFELQVKDKQVAALYHA